MRSRTIFAFVLGGFTAVSLSAQATPPNFAGVWRINVSKSGPQRPAAPPAAGPQRPGPRPQPGPQIAPDTTLKIEQNGAVLTVTQRATEHGHAEEETMRYPLQTGLLTVNPAMGTRATSRSRWAGTVLMVDTIADLGESGYHARDRWSLSADGSTLTLNQSVRMGTRPPSHLVEVFERASATAWAPDPPAKPAGEVFKNVKVLKDLPANELIPTMRGFTKALGVNCGFCHKPGAFDSDELPHKRTARKMLQMVQQINSTTFDGKPRVACWTCHAGHQEPQHVPPAPSFQGQ
jgi:hypothetical protein